ncbi:MAG TPA: hypothetical protein VN039_13815 [Nitrospira sp.]|nr:hypothetical protein [Nitrospira sp.]
MKVKKLKVGVRSLEESLQEFVHADLELLADLDLVQLQSGAHLRGSATPTIPYERIQFEIAV